MGFRDSLEGSLSYKRVFRIARYPGVTEDRAKKHRPSFRPGQVASVTVPQTRRAIGRRVWRIRAVHHGRTSNPIESTFASLRLRTAKTRGCVSRASILSMVFKLTKSAEQRWLKLRGPERIAEVIRGLQFKNGVCEDLKKIAA